jgi:hypothetical protein
LRHIFQGKELSKAPSGASESTLRRWRDEYQPKLQEWAGLLEALIFILTGNSIPLLKISINPLKRLEQVLSFLPALPEQWAVITKALWWLSKTHPL